jgi:hypothetical protein
MQAPPLQSTPAVWRRLLRGVGTVVSLLKLLFGGFMGFVLAIIFMLPQTFHVVLLFMFPARFRANPAWEQAVITALILLAYTLTAYQHCKAAKQYEETSSLPIIGLHILFLLSSFLLSKVFFS